MVTGDYFVPSSDWIQIGFTQDGNFQLLKAAGSIDIYQPPSPNTTHHLELKCEPVSTVICNRYHIRLPTAPASEPDECGSRE